MVAFATATELDFVSLPDALELVLLVADNTKRFRRAALGTSSWSSESPTSRSAAWRTASFRSRSEQGDEHRAEQAFRTATNSEDAGIAEQAVDELREVTKGRAGEWTVAWTSSELATQGHAFAIDGLGVWLRRSVSRARAFILIAQHGGLLDGSGACSARVALIPLGATFRAGYAL